MGRKIKEQSMEEILETMTEDAESKRLGKESGGLERVHLALTPSSVTKAALLGKFSFIETRHAYEGAFSSEEYEHKCVVPWTTIKEIMAAIRKLALLEIDQIERWGSE